MAQDDRPRVRVTLPDGQYVIARLHERRQRPQAGWMYLVGLPAWENTESEGVVAREYRVWLIPGKQVDPIPGISYEDVPTFPLSANPEPETTAAGSGSDRWAFKVQRLRPEKNRGPGGVVVHIWDCEDAPAGNEELDVYEALEVMRTVAGAVLCKECGAAVALSPLLEP